MQLEIRLMMMSDETELKPQICRPENKNKTLQDDQSALFNYMKHFFVW